MADCCEHGNNAGTVVVVERLNSRRTLLNTMRIHAIQKLVLHRVQAMQILKRLLSRALKFIS